MMPTAQFDTARQAISVKHEEAAMRLRYSPFAEHAKAFHRARAGQFSQMRHVVGREASYDAIQSDA